MHFIVWIVPELFVMRSINLTMCDCSRVDILVVALSTSNHPTSLCTYRSKVERWTCFFLSSNRKGIYVRIPLKSNKIHVLLWNVQLINWVKNFLCFRTFSFIISGVLIFKNYPYRKKIYNMLNLYKLYQLEKVSLFKIYTKF